MGGTQFNIDDANFRAIVSKGILDSLSDESKNLMISEAISFLLTEQANPSTHYGAPKTTPSPITMAFRQAVQGVANDVVKEYINQAEVKALIAAGVSKQMKTLLADEGGWLIDAVGQAVGNAITVRRTEN